MTRLEAIEILEKHHMWTGEPQELIEVRKENEALNMAISALSENKCFDGMTNGEVIQAVISELKPIVLSNETGAIYFDWDWWNAPYKAERGE